MAAVCDICGKGPGFGKSVSHSHRRTSRRWDPNIQTVRAVTHPDVSVDDDDEAIERIPRSLSGAAPRADLAADAPTPF